MITFNCEICGEPIGVPESSSDQTATCATCGNSVSIPTPVAKPEMGRRPKHRMAASGLFDVPAVIALLAAPAAAWAAWNADTETLAALWSICGAILFIGGLVLWALGTLVASASMDKE